MFTKIWRRAQEGGVYTVKIAENGVISPWGEGHIKYTYVYYSMFLIWDYVPQIRHKKWIFFTVYSLAYLAAGGAIYAWTFDNGKRNLNSNKDA